MSMMNPILESIERKKQVATGNTIPDKLVSSDSHVTEPAHCYSKYIDPKFRDRAPKMVTNSEGGSSFVIDGVGAPVPMGIVAAAGINPREIRMAAAKLIAGPAATMIARCHTGLAWKVRARSSGGSESQAASGWLAGFMSPANLT